MRWKKVEFGQIYGRLTVLNDFILHKKNPRKLMSKLQQRSTMIFKIESLWTRCFRVYLTAIYG
jgi:hypothetical protein